MTRRFPAPALPAPGETVALGPEASHHLLHVALVPRGRAVILFDGGGAECDGRVVGAEDGLALVEATGPARRAHAVAPLLLLQGLPRKPAWERVLRMGTELGVTGFLPFPAARSVARGLHGARWEKIVQSAAGQCGRGDEPTVSPMADLARALAAVPEGLERFVLTPGAPPIAPSGGGVALLLGPEGGLSPEELQAAEAAAFTPAGLGRWTLRADTAAVAAATLVLAARE